MGAMVSTRLKLLGGKLAFLFLDGKKLKPLRAVHRYEFEDLDACIAWPDGPALRIRLEDKGAFETLRAAVDQAQQRPTPVRAESTSTTLKPLVTTPDDSKRPRPSSASATPPAKRQTLVRNSVLAGRASASR